MFLLYRTLINIIFVFSPIIIFFRLIKKKENLSRFKEKFCFFSEQRIRGNLIWFHAASIGESLSILTLVEEINQAEYLQEICKETPQITIGTHERSNFARS